MYRMIMPDELQEEIERLMSEYDKYPDINMTLKEYIDKNCSEEMKAYQEETVKLAKEAKKKGIHI